MENSSSNNNILKIALEEFHKLHPTTKIDPLPIGKGGMKVVYRAIDEEQHLQLVIKVIRILGSDSEQRTKREIDILKSFSSPYFPKIYDTHLFTIDCQDIFIISESFISGVTLREYEKNKITIDSAIHIGKELLKSLILVHEQHFVHRDIKPENIMITNNKNLILLDFGIARDLQEDSITSDLAIFGPMTIGYAAAEQISNKKRLISERTDLFSWAVVMTEMLIGVNPLSNATTSKNEILQNTLNFSCESIEWGETPVDLVKILQKNLSPKIHRRSTSAREILTYLEKKGI